MKNQRHSTDDDRALRIAHLNLPIDAYVKRQVDAMVDWFSARRDVLDFVTVEPHGHFGEPLGQPYSMEAA